MTDPKETVEQVATRLGIELRRHDWEMGRVWVDAQAISVIAFLEAENAKLRGTSGSCLQCEEKAREITKLRAERNEAVAMAKTVYRETDFYADWDMQEAPLVVQEVDEDLFALKMDHNSLLAALMSIRDMVNQPLTWTTAKYRQQAGEGKEEARCQRCGYTEEDKRTHGDHYLCAEDKAQQSVERLCDRQQAGEGE